VKPESTLEGSPEIICSTFEHKLSSPVPGETGQHAGSTSKLVCSTDQTTNCFNYRRRIRSGRSLAATGISATVLVGIHSYFDFSLQMPAVAMTYACIMGIACAQSYSSSP